MSEPSIKLHIDGLEDAIFTADVSRTEEGVDLYLDVFSEGVVRLSAYQINKPSMYLINLSADEAEMLGGAFIMAVKKLRGEL